MGILTVHDMLRLREDHPKALRDAGIRSALKEGVLTPDTEIIRKVLPSRLLRFEEGEQAIVGVISDLRKDRDNEVLLPEGMDDSQYSGIVLWQHDHWREDIPHARSAWRQLDPKGAPTQILAKTIYLGELSELGHKVFLYRKDENPLGQSVGFRSVESVRKGETGYDEVFKAWVPRVKALLKELGIKPTADEFKEPFRFFTKWEMWEYSDVFVGSNPDALQVAVSKNILTNQEARELVSFEAPAESEPAGELEELRSENADLKVTINLMAKKLAEPDPPVLDLQEIWDKTKTQPTLKELWDKTTAM